MLRSITAAAVVMLVFPAHPLTASADQHSAGFTQATHSIFFGPGLLATHDPDTIPANKGHRHMMRGRGHGAYPPVIAEGDLPMPDAPGRGLVVAYCSQCHGIPAPGLHTATDWDNTASRMFLRMDHMANRGGGGRGRGAGMRMRHIRAPTSQERIVLLDYLKSAALLPTDVAPAPPATGAPPASRKPEADPSPPGSVDRSEADQGEAAVTLFTSTCSRCHALPNPAQHTAQDWPVVVKRMRRNMRRFGTAVMSDEQEREIVSYLQSERRGP